MRLRLAPFKKKYSDLIRDLELDNNAQFQLQLSGTFLVELN